MPGRETGDGKVRYSGDDANLMDKQITKLPIDLPVSAGL
jgi:hypothetical protein